MSSKKKTNLNKAEWDELYSLYESVQNAPPEERAALVDSLTRGKSELRSELVYFLEEEESLSSFLEEPLGKRAAAMLPPSDLTPGTQVGDYVILEVLGKGSFATVYRAQDVTLDREVALKVSPIFGQEARTIAQFEHDHIIRVFAQVNLTDRNLRLIAMQYVPSVNLEELIEGLKGTPDETLDGRAIVKFLDARIKKIPYLSPTTYEERERLAEMSFTKAVVWMGARLAEALAHAHGQGVLHLDVKPGNILVNHLGKPHLTDFNVAVNRDSLKNGVPTNFGGTFDFMPPEQRAVFGAKDKAEAVTGVDERSDVYSLGVVLKKFLTLKRTPSWNSREAYLLLDRATSEKAEHRFANAAEMAKALEGCLELMEIRSSIPRKSRLSIFSNDYPLTSLTLLGAIPQVVAGVVGWSYNSLRIVSTLSEGQMNLFRVTNLTYNPISYSLATAAWIYLVMRLRPFLASPEKFTRFPEAVDEARRKALALPLWGIAVTTLGWVPGALLYPYVLHTYGGGISRAVTGHFLISFGLSYLIALAYCYLLHQFVVLRAIYPRLWLGTRSVQETAKAELRPIARRLRAFCVLTVSIPLWSAAMLLFVGPDRFDAKTYQEFRLLVTFLISAGGAGVWFALSANQELNRAIFSFAGRSKETASEN